MKLDPNASLHGLPAEYFQSGGAIANMLKSAGYADSATDVIGSLAAWSWTVAELQQYIEK